MPDTWFQRSYLGRLTKFLPVLLAAGYSYQLTAQITPSTETALGSSPYATYNGGNIDSINPVSGNVFLHIPLLSYPQRGHALRLAFNIYYNDKRWFIRNETQNIETGQVQGQWSYFNSGSSSSNAGVYVARDQHLEIGLDINQSTQVTGESYDPTSTTYTYYNYWVREPDGAQHYDGDAGQYSCNGPACTPPSNQ